MISHHNHAAACYKQRVATAYTEVKMWDYDKRKWSTQWDIIMNCRTVGNYANLIS